MNEMAQIIDLFFLSFEVEGDREGAALPRRAFHGDRAIHEARDVLCDGHAKAGALDLARSLIIGTDERLEHDLLEGTGHADAIVFDDKFIVPAPSGFCRDLPDRESDPSAVRRVLDGVRHDVHEELPEAQAVAPHFFVCDFRNVHIEPVSVLLDPRAADGDDVVHKIRQVEFLFIQRDLPIFDTRHIEDFIDELQKMVARLRDLPQAVSDALLIIDVRAGDGGHADDRIHGRADIMRHVGQEFGLGLIRTVRCLTGITQCIMGTDLRKLLFCGVLSDQQYFLDPAVFPLDG